MQNVILKHFFLAYKLNKLYATKEEVFFMERVLSPDEKLRRAEEIYYRRKCENERRVNNCATVNVGSPKSSYLVKRMVIQIIICFVIYCVYYTIQHSNFIFSPEVINKTNEILSYDINLQGMYAKVEEYINKMNVTNNEQNENEITPPQEVQEEPQASSIEETEPVGTIVDTLSASDNGEEQPQEEIAVAVPLSQMEIDANDIKANYSLVVPIKGITSSRYGARESTSEKVSPYHHGIDIAADTGTPIYASMAGIVKYAGVVSGYGKYIEIVSGDVTTIYGHCNAIHVNTGDTITQGQLIGEVGETGNATGPHLHFEIKKQDRTVNPELILSF